MLQHEIFAGDSSQVGFQTSRIIVRLALKFDDFTFLTIFPLSKLQEGNKIYRNYVMVPPKRSLFNFNERALCLITSSVHVNRHTGLLEWADE